MTRRAATSVWRSSRQTATIECGNAMLGVLGAGQRVRFSMMRVRFVLALVTIAASAAGCGSDEIDDGTGAAPAVTVPSAISTDPVMSVAPSGSTGSGTVLICGPLPADSDGIAALLRSRLDAYNDAEFTIDGAAPTQVEIRVPGGTTDAQAAAICARPRLEARPVLQIAFPIPGASVPDAAPFAPSAAGIFFGPDGTVYTLGPVVVGGSPFEATAEAELSGDAWTVIATLTPDGLDDWNAAAACFAGDDVCPSRQLAMLLDDQVITAPTVNAPEFSGDVQISGIFTEAGARSLAAAINAGAAGFGLISMTPLAESETTLARASTATKGDPFCAANEVGEALGASADFGNASPESIEAQITAMGEAGRSVKALAPQDITATADLVVERQERLLELLADNDYDPAVIAASDEGRALLEDPVYSSAETTFRTYLQEKCGIVAN